MKRDCGNPGEVDLAPLRTAFAESDITIRSVVRVSGLHEKHVRALLGREAWSNGRGQKTWLRGCRYRTAIALCRGMDRDPIDFDL